MKLSKTLTAPKCAPTYSTTYYNSVTPSAECGDKGCTCKANDYAKRTAHNLWLNSPVVCVPEVSRDGTWCGAYNIEVGSRSFHAFGGVPCKGSGTYYPNLLQQGLTHDKDAHTLTNGKYTWGGEACGGGKCTEDGECEF